MNQKVKVKVNFKITHDIRYKVLMKFNSPISKELIVIEFSRKEGASDLEYIKSLYNKIKNLEWVKSQVYNELIKETEKESNYKELQLLIKEINNINYDIELNIQ